MSKDENPSPAELLALAFTQRIYGEYDAYYRDLPAGVALPGTPSEIRFRHMGRTEMEALVRALPAFFSAHPIETWVEINVVGLKNWWYFAVLTTRANDRTMRARLRREPEDGLRQLHAECALEVSYLDQSIRELADANLIILSEDGDWLHVTPELTRYLSSPPHAVFDTLRLHTPN